MCAPVRNLQRWCSNDIVCMETFLLSFEWTRVIHQRASGRTLVKLTVSMI